MKDKTPEELIGEKLYDRLWAEGATQDSFVLIAERLTAAREEGKTKGAEQIKAEIRKHSEHYAGIPGIGSPYYTVFDSVLAPKK